MGFSLCGDHTRKTVHWTVFSPKGEHANKFARSLFKSHFCFSQQKKTINRWSFLLAEKMGFEPWKNTKLNLKKHSPHLAICHFKKFPIHFPKTQKNAYTIHFFSLIQPRWSFSVGPLKVITLNTLT